MSKSGFILIAVLWITAILSILALNFSTSARMQGLQTLNMEGRIKDTQFLKSGLTLGYHEYLKYRENRSLLEEKEEIEKIAEQSLSLWYPRYEPYLTTIGNEKMAIQIINLEGKISINEVDLDLLQEILGACGLKNSVRMTSVANSILDWIDADNMKRAEGAEKDYYLSQPQPYLPKDNEIESIEELLLVKDITPELFYGTSEYPGLVDFFTVFGQNEKMDINNAAPQTFAILQQDIPQEIVEQIVSLRQEEPISKLSEISDIVPQKYYSLLTKYYHVVNSETPKIRAYKVLEDNELGRSLQKTYAQE